MAEMRLLGRRQSTWFLTAQQAALATHLRQFPWLPSVPEGEPRCIPAQVELHWRRGVSELREAESFVVASLFVLCFAIYLSRLFSVKTTSSGQRWYLCLERLHKGQRRLGGSLQHSLAPASAFPNASYTIPRFSSLEQHCALTSLFSNSCQWFPTKYSIKSTFLAWHR